MGDKVTKNVFLYAFYTAIALLLHPKGICGAFLIPAVNKVCLPWLGRILASTDPSAAPAPVLEVSSRSSDSVVLICQAPAGHLGVLFRLYRVTEEVNFKDTL